MNFLFSFEEMITPRLIALIYAMMLLTIVVTGIGGMFVPFGLSFWGILRGAFIIVLGALVARVWCELLIVIFKINENLHKLANK